MSEPGDLVRRVLDGLPVGIWVAEVPSGDLAYANQTFEQIMGIDARDDVGVGEYAAPYGICTRDGDPYPEERMPFVRALEAGHRVTADDIVIHRHDGGRVNIRAWATPLFDDRGQMTHVAIAFSDITAEVEADKRRIESEARLQRTRRMESIGQLAGGVAHDFNNLLTALGIVAGSLGRRAPSSVRADVDRIIEVTDRAAELTRSLLGFAGRGKNRSEPLGLHQVIESLAELWRRTLDRRIELRLELGAGSGVVVGDCSQIEQVLMNLVLNARDAVDGSGVVTIATADLAIADGDGWSIEAGDYVLVAVEDTGPGIPAELRDQVFEPYFTTKTSGPQRGTGLGLATAHGIVEAHGGRIRVAGGATGARFELVLPASDRASVTRSRRTAPPRPGTGTVLVIDDEDLVRDAAARALRAIGYTALEARSGHDGVALFADRGDEIIAVLLDMMMPEMDGKATFLALRDVDPSVRVILMSGYTGDDDIAEILGLGVEAFLPKPFSIGDLSDCLARRRTTI